MIPKEEFIQLTNDLKNLRHQCGEEQWKWLFVENEDFKEEIDQLIKYYKESPDSYKGEVLYYLNILHLAEPKAVHPDLYNPEKVNI